MAESLAALLHSGAVTGSGASESVDLQSDGVGLRRVASVELEVHSGASLTVFLETSRDGVNWRRIDQAFVASAPHWDSRFVGDLERYARAGWELSGAASFTLRITADQSYATIEQLFASGAPESLLGAVDRSTLWLALFGATDEAHGYIDRGPGTIIAVGPRVVSCVCQIAAVDLVSSQVGVDSRPESIELLVEAARTARAWLAAVSAGKADGRVITTESVPGDESTTVSGAAESDPPRGWEDLAP